MTENTGVFTELVTDAPESYDGFGTTTVDRAVATDQGRSGTVGWPAHQLRRVRVSNEHLDWQINRYASGLYYRLTEEQFRQFVEAGLLVVTDTSVDEDQQNVDSECALQLARAADAVLRRLELRVQQQTEAFDLDRVPEGISDTVRKLVAAVGLVAEELGPDVSDEIDVTKWAGVL